MFITIEDLWFLTYSGGFSYDGLWRDRLLLTTQQKRMIKENPRLDFEIIRKRTVCSALRGRGGLSAEEAAWRIWEKTWMNCAYRANRVDFALDKLQLDTTDIRNFSHFPAADYKLTCLLNTFKAPCPFITAVSAEPGEKWGGCWRWSLTNSACSRSTKLSAYSPPSRATSPLHCFSAQGCTSSGNLVFKGDNSIQFNSILFI